MKIQDQIFEKKKKCHNFVTDHLFQKKCFLLIWDLGAH